MRSEACRLACALTLLMACDTGNTPVNNASSDLQNPDSDSTTGEPDTLLGEDDVQAPQDEVDTGPETTSVTDTATPATPDGGGTDLQPDAIEDAEIESPTPDAETDTAEIETDTAEIESDIGETDADTTSQPIVTPPCVEDSDCDDDGPCTDDECWVGECVHFAVDDCCMSDEVCAQPPQPCAFAVCEDHVCVTDTSGCAEELAVVSTAAGDTPQGWLDGPVEEAMFGEVRGLAIDAAGIVYLADWMTHSVRTIADGMVATLAGEGCANGAYNMMTPPICGSYVDGLISEARFDMPLEVAVSEPGPTVWVSDMFNFRIRRIVDGYVSTALGTGEQGYVDGPAETAQMGFVGGIVVRPDGELLFSDGSAHAVRSLADDVVTTVAGTGSPGFMDGPADLAMFDEPVGLALTAEGGVVIADWHNHRIRLLLDGEVTTLAGSGVEGLSDGPAHEATFNEPGGVAVASDGAIYVSDFSNHAIRRIADGVVTTVAGGETGYQDGSVDDALFASPIDLAIDPFDNLWVSDNQNRAIRLITP